MCYGDGEEVPPRPQLMPLFELKNDHTPVVELELGALAFGGTSTIRAGNTDQSIPMDTSPSTSASSARKRRRTAASTASATASTTDPSLSPPTASARDLPCWEIDAGAAAPALQPGDLSLGSFVHPIPADVWHDHVFRQRAFVAHGAAARVAALARDGLCGLDVKALLEATASDQVFVWIATDKQPASRANAGAGGGVVAAAAAGAEGCAETAASAVATKGGRLLQSIEVQDPAVGAILNAAGHSTVRVWHPCSSRCSPPYSSLAPLRACSAHSFSPTPSHPPPLTPLHSIPPT